jgi:oligopeptide transport system ATP-binding protein
MKPLLDVRHLQVSVPGPSGLVSIVDGVNYTVLPGQVLGIAGESGSGKTTSALALMGLGPAGAVISGTAIFGDQDLLKMTNSQLRAVRGRDIAMVFQDPMTSLDPMMTIERQLTEHARYHLKLNRNDSRDRAIDLLREVRIPDPVGSLHAYPHQFSGGMRQRIAIAMALICKPRLLIADEPTSALDVTVQAGILRLLEGLRERFNLSIILITHDLGVMSSIADQLIIFYAGRVVESGSSETVLRHTRHPYTAGLLSALPHPEAAENRPLVFIPGSSPSPLSRPVGCAFHPRCPYAVVDCALKVPDLVTIDRSDHALACPVDPLRGRSDWPC